MKRIAALISGRGSNLEALLNAQIPGVQWVVVISNKPQVRGLAVAERFGVATEVLDQRAFSTRADYDAALLARLEALELDWVLLAGFMRVLGASLVRRFWGRMVNIHPSLLPAFPGLHTHKRALEAGVRLHGATVHFVAEEVDAGPIIVQAAVPVLPGDDEASLAARVLEVEHRIYPLALRWLVEERVVLGPDQRVHYRNCTFPEAPFWAPWA